MVFNVSALHPSRHPDVPAHKVVRRQHLVPRLRDEHLVLAPILVWDGPDREPTVVEKERLDADNLVRLEHRGVVLGDARHLVQVEPNVVPDARPPERLGPLDKLRVSGVADRLLGRLVHLTVGHARSDSIDGGLLSLTGDVVEPALVLRRLTKAGKALDVGVVPVVRAPAVELDEAAGVDLHLAARRRVRPRALGQAPHTAR